LNSLLIAKYRSDVRPILLAPTPLISLWKPRWKFVWRSLGKYE